MGKRARHFCSKQANSASMIKVSTICSLFVLQNGLWCGVREQPRPRRPEGFALIRLLYGGICNTDLELQRGYYGFRGTPGHEFVGEVVAADDRKWVGRARGGRDQPGLRRMRMVRARPGPPLPKAHACLES